QNRNNPFIGNGGGIERILQRGLTELQQNPELQRGIFEMIGRFTDSDVNFDPQRKELTISTDFTKLYDKMAERDPEKASPEMRALAANLETLRLSPDTLDLKFKQEQILALGKDGPAKDFKLALGADRGWTTFDVASTQTS